MLLVTSLHRHFESCSNALHKRAAFHFVNTEEVNIKSDSIENDTSMPNLDCTMSPSKVLYKFLDRLIKKPRTHKSKKPSFVSPYPQSHSRNLALSGVRTTHHLLLDIDIVLSDDASQQLDSFIQNNELDEKVVLVVPVYEVKKTVKHLPGNRIELRPLLKAKTARQYHIEQHRKNSGSSDYARYELDEKSDDTA